eukprot:CAMPEP_0181111568 /NCGR_PEP_ID=MMETSP1071-20121207/19343_1 /TAXON_ID=35127 /ORGANISM="Thalassiosira sp., Strain NH16" /LENGTH=477 /DNA_ID=CAMNT_0023195467 /DNA_START=81 /DNA_END=1514 /DNA_ORIENTATION=-
MSDTKNLPVIIAGAGPCGLVAALSLQRAGVPFVIYDRASAARLCSNSGSGIDMAPCAIKILENELRMGRAGLDRAISPYEYMHTIDSEGKTLNTYRFKDLKYKITDSRNFGFANRSDLQHALLEELGLKDKDGNIRDDRPEDETVLHCGVAIKSYENHPGHVEVQLSNGTSIRGLALLACDGIHSVIREHMHRDIDDSLNYCGQVAWWGKTTVEKGSTLDDELTKMAKDNDMEDGNFSLAMIGTRKKPGVFYSCEVAENVHAWVYVLKDKNPPAANASNDLTRRGGVALTGEEKQKEMNKLVASTPAVVRAIMTHASADDVTRAGFFDRANQTVAYVDGRVALLGDAAHPQSPMMGQGANMAIVDGFVAATRISAAVKSANENAIKQALLAFDCDIRRKDNTAVVKKARQYGHWSTTKNRFVNGIMRASLKYAPASMMINEIVSGDKSNRKFVASMKKDMEANGFKAHTNSANTLEQ